jgi:hypothetical protein
LAPRTGLVSGTRVTPLVEGRAGGARTLKTDVCDGYWEVLLTVLIVRSVKFIRFVLELLVFILEVP